MQLKNVLRALKSGFEKRKGILIRESNKSVYIFILLFFQLKLSLFTIEYTTFPLGRPRQACPIDHQIRVISPFLVN